MNSDIILKTYNIEYAGSKDIKLPLRIVFMSDLHFYAARDMENAKHIADMIQKLSPDMVLSAGDLIYACPDDNYEAISSLFDSIQKICPCFCVNGNYESKVNSFRVEFGKTYDDFSRILQSKGARIINNMSVPASDNDGEIIITGYEAPLKLYKKFRRHHLSLYGLESSIGKCNRRKYNILLAHNPLFADTYFEWGADLILCGHFHGGLIRAGDKALMSPYGFPLPRYGYGRFNKKDQTLIVTAGGGNNYVKIRVNNPKEIVCLNINNSTEA